MLTDSEIRALIILPKIITSKDPATGYKEEDGHQRCRMKLESASGDGKEFSIFINQNDTFRENFSIGLRYKTMDKALGAVTLVRYNGAHGETSRNQDNHYHQPHIHYITAAGMQSGSNEPQESHREVTDKYDIFEDALRCFFEDIGVGNYLPYFPELMQIRIF